MKKQYKSATIRTARTRVNEMSIIKGVVQFVKQRDKNYSILINDIWVSGLRQCPVSKDDEVMIDTEKSKDGKYLNITNIEIMDSTIKQSAGEITSKHTAPQPSPASAYNKDKILFQVCLKVAGNILAQQSKEIPIPSAVNAYAEGLFNEVKK